RTDPQVQMRLVRRRDDVRLRGGVRTPVPPSPAPRGNGVGDSTTRSGHARVPPRRLQLLSRRGRGGTPESSVIRPHVEGRPVLLAGDLVRDYAPPRRLVRTPGPRGSLRRAWRTPRHPQGYRAGSHRGDEEAPRALSEVPV